MSQRSTGVIALFVLFSIGLSILWLSTPPQRACDTNVLTIPKSIEENNVTECNCQCDVCETCKCEEKTCNDTVITIEKEVIVEKNITVERNITIEVEGKPSREAWRHICGTLDVFEGYAYPRFRTRKLPKIYDTFTFLNELELLMVRMGDLYDVVDYFVIVESGESFTGKKKPYTFWENRERFEKYMDKVRYVNCSLPKNGAWDREYFQRDCAKEGMKDADPDDIMLIGDVDELVSPISLYVMKYCDIVIERTGERHLFASPTGPSDLVIGYNMRRLHFDFHCESKQLPSQAVTSAVPVRRLETASPSEIRRARRGNPDIWLKKDLAGWHCSFYANGDPYILKTKFDSVSHTEIAALIDMDSIKTFEDLIKNRGSYQTWTACQDISPLNLPRFVLDHYDTLFVNVLDDVQKKYAEELRKYQ